VIEAVSGGGAARGVVPFENAIEGAVNSTIDTLVFEAELFIKRRISIPVDHALMSRRPAFSKIISHPQALAQCRRFISANYPDTDVYEAASTAEAARLASMDESAAAVAAPAAAELYGLNVIRRGIMDASGNSTQFVLISKEDTTEPQPGRSAALAFSTENRPGGLYGILDLVAIWDINMTKILSRPIKGRNGEYIFFVELECGNTPEAVDDVKDALKMVARKSSFYKPLGVYEASSREAGGAPSA
jgi:prephenate dehydratase